MSSAVPSPQPAPMAPSLAAWASMSEAERAAVLATLVSIPSQEAHPPEGDDHINAWLDAADALENWFRAKKKKAYIGRGITAFYPERPRFAPDLFVVLEAEAGPRSTWVVNREGRGLDFVLEIHAQGDKKKDTQLNVARYAELGIREYVIYDAKRRSLTGYRLEQAGCPYALVMQQLGKWRSDVLGLWIGIRDDHLRFFDELHVVPFERELNQELSKALAQAERLAALEAERATHEAERAAHEAERAAHEAERAAALERENAQLRAALLAAGGVLPKPEPSSST